MVDSVVDCFFLVDIVLQFFMAIKDGNGSWVFNHRYGASLGDNAAMSCNACKYALATP